MNVFELSFSRILDLYIENFFEKPLACLTNALMTYSKAS